MHKDNVESLEDRIVSESRSGLDESLREGAGQCLRFDRGDTGAIRLRIVDCGFRVNSGLHGIGGYRLLS